MSLRKVSFQNSLDLVGSIVFTRFSFIIDRFNLNMIWYDNFNLDKDKIDVQRSVKRLY